MPDPAAVAGRSAHLEPHASESFAVELARVPERMRRYAEAWGALRTYPASHPVHEGLQRPTSGPDAGFGLHRTMMPPANKMISVRISLRATIGRFVRGCDLGGVLAKIPPKMNVPVPRGIGIDPMCSVFSLSRNFRLKGIQRDEALHS